MNSPYSLLYSSEHPGGYSCYTGYTARAQVNCEQWCFADLLLNLEMARGRRPAPVHMPLWQAEGLLRCKPRWQARGCPGAQWLHTSRPQACSGGRRPAACAGTSKAGTRQILLPALADTRCKPPVAWPMHALKNN